MRIYLDHNATTPVESVVSDAIARVLREQFGNPSSIHSFGQTTKSLIDDARANVAKLIGGRPQEIVFTSGGTESDNLAVRGVAGALESSNRRRLIASTIEHEAVLHTLNALTKQGWDTTLLPVNSTGVVCPEDLRKAITNETALVSIMHANNEIGTIQPIAELADIAHEHGAIFHTDAVQTVGKVPVNVTALGIDLLSLSAHKFNGPKGVGALWIRRGARLVSNVTGGRQERNRRAGTENVAGIVGLGTASRITMTSFLAEGQRISSLRDKLEKEILLKVPGTVVNGDTSCRIPNTTNISFDGVEAESLLIALDLEGIAVSTGSACSSGTLEPSHVLIAMGFSPHRTQSSIRFSLGKHNTNENINQVITVLPKAVEKLRKLSGARRSSTQLTNPTS